MTSISLNDHSGNRLQDSITILKVGKFKMVITILNGLNLLNLLRKSEC